MSTRQIMLKHSISESTFHRHRRSAILVLARELRRQEELHEGNSKPPTAILL